MDGSGSRVLDHAICGSCKHLFTEKDKIIDDLKRNLLTQENRVKDLENEAKNVEKRLRNLVQEKDALEQLVKQDENIRNIEILQNQLKLLEEEKKYLNDKINDFEHETDGLARMFGIQQEKFEYEMKSKDKTLTAVETETKRLKDELENTRKELGKMKTEMDAEKDIVAELKRSVQKKDEEVSNLSNLHHEAKLFIKELEKQLFTANENLRNQRSKNKILEENISSCKENVKVISEESKRLETENNQLRVSQLQMSEEISRAKKEQEKLNDRIQCLQMESTENQKKYDQLKECNVELRQDKNDTETQVRNMKKQDLELRTDVEKLKKEVMLVTDQNHALESKMSLVRAEIKNVETLKRKLEHELSESHQRLEKAEENLANRTIEKETLQEDVSALEKAIKELELKNEQSDEHLERTEEILESETKARERLEEDVKALDQIIHDLKANIQQQKKYLQETKQELDSVLVMKQQLVLEVEKLEELNTGMKANIDTLSKDIESMHGVCQTKTEKLEDLERSMNEKSKVILSHEQKEQELRNHVEELLGMEEICANELKNVRNELTKLRKENEDMEVKYEKVTLQYQECLKELSQKNEMYMKIIAQYEKQMEELSHFRELNAEINGELRTRNDEINLLTMEKDKLLRERESARIVIEKNSSTQANLKKELESMKLQMEKYKDSEKEVLQKLSEAKRKHESVVRELDNERDEINNLESQLKYSREKAERWKKIGCEIKQERNRLQIQLADLDRDLNEKSSNLAEEKSTLENEMGTLKLVVKRLKSNEENLRGKIEELRDEVDKLSDANSEQEIEIRKLSWEKQRIEENLFKLKDIAGENISLQNKCTEINCENTKLKNDIDALQEKAKDLEEHNEKMLKEHKILQDHVDVIQVRIHESALESKQLKNNINILQDNNDELSEEKERLLNENCRLKEKKSSIIQDRNKLQDMVESLDKCLSEKNDALSRQNTLLENELAARRTTIKKCEEKELRLLNGIQELNEKIENSIEENDKINGLLKKADCENIRLRKKISDLAKVVEQIDYERETRINLEAELSGKDEVLKKYKESKKNLNDLISTLYNQQVELRNELRNKEREFNDLNDHLKTEQSDKAKWKGAMTRLEEELQKTKANEVKYSDQVKIEQEKTQQVLTKLKEQCDNFKEMSQRDKDEYHENIKNFEVKRNELLNKIEKLQDDYDKARNCNVNLQNKIRTLEEEMFSLKEKKCQQDRNLKTKDEKLVYLVKETDALKKENNRLQEHAENIDMILSIQNSAALDQASGMEKEIKVLHDTLAQLRTNRDINRAEIDELKTKLETSYKDKMDAEVKICDIQLERERLQCKNDDLLSNCARLERLAKEAEQIKLEHEGKQQLVENEQQRNRVIEEKLANKSQELLEKGKLLDTLKEEISGYKKTIEKLNMSKDGLIVSVEELTQMSDEGLKELQRAREENEELLSENNRLTESVALCNDVIENLRKEGDRVKTDLQLKTQEAENDKFQLQNDVKMKEESLQRLTEKNNEIQDSLKNVREEVDDLESENEDILAEVEQMKEVNKKAKGVFCVLQTEHSILQEELREKSNVWNEEKEKLSLEILKMETDTTNLNKRLAQANDRNEKQRELEKMLRFEIDELSDGYVEMEQEVQHRNDEITSLREKLQTLSQNIEELELARDTACLLKEKRHCELLNSEKNVQRLEKHLKENQKMNSKLQKEMDSFMEREKYLQLQISSEKELGEQHLKQIQDLQNSQRKVDEELWKAKRDIEKLQMEIETWRISDDSMKVRIETLEDELNKTANEKLVASSLYEEANKKSEARAEQILKLMLGFTEKTAAFETAIGEVKKEKNDLSKEINNLEFMLKEKSGEVASLKELLENINIKYEDALLMTSLLHNDIEKKDEKIADLEDRRKNVTNLLADLDFKIAEIQIQAERLETDNESLRKQVARAIESEEHLKQTLEEERKEFADKFSRNSREIQHLQNTKDHFKHRLLEANSKIEDKNNEIVKLQRNHEKLTADKHCLVNTKERLENELWKMKSDEEELALTLKTLKEKILKQNSEIEHYVNDCQLLETKCSDVSREHKETERRLVKANTVCKDLESSLEEKKAKVSDLLTLSRNWKDKANQLEKSLSVSTAENDKLLKMKNEEIESLTTSNREMRSVIDEVKSELDKQAGKCYASERENKDFSEEDLEHFDEISAKEEKKSLLTKIEAISRDFCEIKTEKQQLMAENKDINCVMKMKENEFEEGRNVFRMSQQKLKGELFEHKSALENLVKENNDLRQKVGAEKARTKQTTKSLNETRGRLEDQEMENEKLKLQLQNSNFERNCLVDVNSKVSDALLKLQKESNTSLCDDTKEINVEGKQTQQECVFLESETKSQKDMIDHSIQSKQAFLVKSFELQNNFSLIEDEVRSLRTVVSKKEDEITDLEETLDLLKKEIDVQSSQLSSYIQKLRDESKQKTTALETIEELEADVEHLKKENHSIAAGSQKKMMHLQHEILANESVICDLRGKNVRLEENLQVLNSLNDEKANQIKELENMGITKKLELEALEKILEECNEQILSLEKAADIRREEKFCCNSGHDHIARYDEISSNMAGRLEQVRDNIHCRMMEEKRLQKVLTDVSAQSSKYHAELEASESSYKSLKVKYEQSQTQLSLVTSSRDEALCKVAELSESLTSAETKIESTRISQNMENSKISQELQKMQKELTLACDKFKCSISKSISLEEKIKTKEKRIAVLEKTVEMSGVNDRMLQMRIAELETTTELLSNANKELENTERRCEEKIAELQSALYDEKAGRYEDITERDTTVRKLELKNESLGLQIVRSKELLNKMENSSIKLQKEFDALKSRCEEEETTSSAEIAECHSKIVELQQNISNLQNDASRLENDRCALIQKNEDLMKTVYNVQRENKDYKNTLKQNEKDKEAMNTTLERVFNIALNEKVCNDINSQTKSLERVVQAIEELKSEHENLTKEKQDVMENLLKLENENKKILSHYRAKCEQYELQQENNDKLADLTQELESKLNGSDVKCQQLNLQIRELEEKVETLSANEDHQQYQYHVLEKEKENLENEIINFNEGIEKLTEKINDSVHLLHESNSDSISGSLEDSGIGIDDNSLNLLSNRGSFDARVFECRFTKCSTFPASSKPKEGKQENEKLRYLETTVDTFILVMSRIVPSFNEREKLFCNREKQFVDEIRELKQASVQNENLLSSLEKEVECLELSQKSLQETYHEKDEKLKECQMKLEHAISITKEKEISITILNESVQEYKKGKKDLEKELDTTKKSHGQLIKENLQTSITIHDCKKEFEILRQQCLENDAETEKTTTSLRLQVTELENQILEEQNNNLELQHLCTTLRGTVKQLEDQAQEYSLTITTYKNQAKDLERQINEDAKLAVHRSQELDDCRERIGILEEMNQEIEESFKEIKNKSDKIGIDLEKSRREVTQLKEENVLIRLEKNSLTDKIKTINEQLKEKEKTIKQLSEGITEKDEMIRKNEAKLELLKDFLQKMNVCKDTLEKDVDELKDEKSICRRQIELLKDENQCLLESVKKKNEEIIEKESFNFELDKKNKEIRNELKANNTALTKALDELHLSLVEARRIYELIEGVCSLFDPNNGYRCSEAGSDDEMNTYNLILSIGTSINNLSILSHKLLIERENLQRDVKEQNLLLQNEKNERLKLETEIKHMNEKVSALSQDLAKVQSLSKEQEQEINQSQNEIYIGKQRISDLVKLNESLKERIKLLNDDVSSISTHADYLKEDRNKLEESLLEAYHEVTKLNAKCEQLGKSDEELRAARQKIDEQNILQDETMTAKENLTRELEYTQQKLTDLEISQTDKTKLLAQERDRIVTLTKLARIKERDLEDATKAMKLKDELIQKLESKAEEMKETNTLTKKELTKVIEQLTTVQQRKEVLLNEKVSLWNDFDALKHHLEKIQKEKQELQLKLHSESKNSSIVLEKLELQRQALAKLENKVEQREEKCSQLENEKSKITNEAKENEKRLELKCGEILEKYHAQERNMDKTLLNLKSELDLSECLRSELERRVTETEEGITALQDQNSKLQADIETFGEQENNLITENKYLKVSAKGVSEENKCLQDCFDKANQHLETMKSSLAEKERENNDLQKEVLSGRKIISSLKNATSTSESEINDLKRKDVENKRDLERLEKEISQEKNKVVALLEDKTNLEELYRVGQNLEDNLRKDLEEERLKMDNIRNENISLRKEKTFLVGKVEDVEKRKKDLKSEFQTISLEKQEVNNQLLEASRNLEKASDDLYRLHAVVARICTSARTIENRFQTGIKTDNQKNPVQTCSPADAVFEELRILEITLTEICSLFENRLESESQSKNNIKDLTLKINILNDQNENQEGEVQRLKDHQNNLLQEKDQLETKNREVVMLCEKLNEEVKRMKEMLTNECAKNTKISNELSSLKARKQEVSRRNHELEVRLDKCLKEKEHLNTKQEELKGEIHAKNSRISSLEANYETLRHENEENNELAVKRKDQILVLESDLKASVEFSAILEKRCTEENENSSKLRLRVETLDSQVSALENNLNISQKQINEMSSKAVSMDEEIQRTGIILRENGKEINQLREKLKDSDEELRTSIFEIEHHKTAHENALKSKEETEEKLKQTELLLNKSETLLQQERRSTNEKIIEMENIEKKLKSTIVKLQERVDELTSALSVTMTKEESTKRNLDNARGTIKKLENELRQQLLKTEESEEKQRKINEQLNILTLDQITANEKLDETLKENKDLNNEKQELRTAMEILETETTTQNQVIEQKLTEIKNLKIQLADEKNAQQNLENEILKLQMDIDILRKQNSEQEGQIDYILETNAAEVDQISEQLVEEISRADELKRNINIARSEMRKMEERNEKICEQILISCQSLVKDLKPSDNCLPKDDSGDITDLSKIIDMVCSSHTIVQEHNHILNTKLSELHERLGTTSKQNKILLDEKAHLEKCLITVQRDNDIIQADRDSLEKALETCQRDLEVNIDELKQQKEALDVKEEEINSLHCEIKEMDKRRFCLEEEVGRLQLKLGNTIIDLTTANTDKHTLENKISDLILTNSSLLSNQDSLQNKLNAAEEGTKELLEKFSAKQSEFLKLVALRDAVEEEKMATEKCLEIKENEVVRLKNNLNELEKEKIDEREQMSNLKELNDRLEKDSRDLQSSCSQTKADNAELSRQIECERSENLTTKTRLEYDLKKALETLERQHSKLSQVQNEKNFLRDQLLQAEKELKVLMEDNADLKQQMYQSTTISRNELITTKFQLLESRRKEAAISQENKCLIEQLRDKSEEFQKLKRQEQGFKREAETSRENMRRYLNERDKWEEEVKSVISEIGQEQKFESTL
ncbi:centromere protein F-like [Dendronephthya gigantea]|uniref:centromere protein F-like n=1 Tax=Dendronephthya gigantea TaxID=151771 RepID=UPI00106C2B3E|nr:centromere protein F-like [Dendronephthya gigantea]